MSSLIAKADGELEPFDGSKLVHSLERAGAETAVARAIGGDIERELYQGITTQELYRHAFAKLREQRRGAAARYSLKRAVLEFGPSGFPFEQYIAALLQAEGYQTKTDQIIRGACVEHEVDVVAQKGEEVVYVEAKFHNTLGFKTDLKTALYVKARLNDIGKGKGLIVTNTKFTSKAIQFSRCSGVELLGWEYPPRKTLHDRIDATGLYPVTALTTLNRREKTALLSHQVVLCSSLPHDTRALASAGVVGHKASQVLEEVAALCVPGAHVE